MPTRRTMRILRLQLGIACRRPARLVLTGLVLIVAAAAVFSTVLAQRMVERTVIEQARQAPSAVDLVITDGSVTGPAALDRVRAAPGVAEAVARVYAGGGYRSEFLDVEADPGVGPLSHVRVVQGRYPRTGTEIALTRRTASSLALPVGSALTLSRQTGPSLRFTVVGLVDPAAGASANGYALLSAVWQLNGDTRIDRVDIDLLPGASAVAAAAAVERALTEPGLYPQVRTAADVRVDEAGNLLDDYRTIFVVIGAFLFVAVAAAAQVTASMFQVLFGQQVHHLAMLRLAGAGRGTLFGALMAEGVLTGATAGCLGVTTAWIGAHLVAPSLHLERPGAVVLQAVLVIVLIALASAVASTAAASKACRVSPLQALRSAATARTGRRSRVVRLSIGLMLATLAVGTAAGAILSGFGETNRLETAVQPLLLIGMSLVSAYLAVVTLGPVLARPLLAVLAWPVRRLGPVGRLAVSGVGGAPDRTSAICIVVALGATLLSGGLVGEASSRIAASQQQAVESPADLRVNAAGGQRIAPAVLSRTAGRAALTHVTAYRTTDRITLTSGRPFGTTDLRLCALPSARQLAVTSGSLQRCGPGLAVVSGWVADEAGLQAGDPVTLRSGRQTAQVTVAAVLASDGPLSAGLYLDGADLTRLGDAAGFDGILADAAAAGPAGRKAAQAALAAATSLPVDTLATGRDHVADQLDTTFTVAYVLFGLIMLIALLGIGASTALSVIERVRECGILRATGLSRRGLRAVLTLESACYGLLGAGLGLALGVPYAALAVSALFPGVPLSVPVGALTAGCIALIVLAALAGAAPAYRAARLTPVTAIGEA